MVLNKQKEKVTSTLLMINLNCWILILLNQRWKIQLHHDR